MAPSATTESLLSSSPDVSENNLQPFFVLHKASSSRKSEKKSTVCGKTRRKIDLSPEKREAEKGKEWNDPHYEHLHMEAFEFVWSKIESNIKDVFRNINVNIFNEMHCWVRESFDAIRSRGTPGYVKATQSYPIGYDDASSKQLFTGLVLTKNMEFVDDLLTFEELGIHLKSHGCHVASLSSLDFSTKNGIGGCLRSLFKQFLMFNLDVADISILASWYSEQGNSNNPVVIIIEDMERCCGSVLSEIILMLSEWVVKIPIILIMGVATTLDAPRNILPSNALQCLCPRTFILGSPAERMDAIVEAVLLKQCSGFSVGYKVAVFMRNYFLRQDGTLTSFIRSLKMACVQHFSMEPLSFMLGGFLVEGDIQGLLCEKQELLPDLMIKNKMVGQTGENLAHGLSELKRLQKCWSTVVLCLYETGKYGKIPLLDLLCEVLDPDLYNSKASDDKSGVENHCVISTSREQCVRQSSCWRKGGFIFQAVRRVRDLPGMLLCQLVKNWEKLTDDIPEIHDKVNELQCMLTSEDGKSLNNESTATARRLSSRSHSYIGKGSKALNEKAAALLECMVRDYMQPIECMPFHEITCYKNVDSLHSALIGDPRRRIQVDLLESQKILRCSCCSKSGSVLLPSMHDTSIMYNLAQEHGDLINLHDWYQSFKSTILGSSTKRKHKVKQSPSSKKRKNINESENISESSVQARFCRAVIELQITGLLRMPSKRRPDFVQRVAFGL